MAATIAVVAPSVPPGGILVFAVVVAMTWHFDARPRELVRVGLTFVATGFVVASIFASPATLLVTVVHTFTWSRAHQVALSLAFTLGYCIEAVVSLFAVATLLAFDRRSVNRTTVDLRVWQRQQTRRRQLLRRWHHRWDIPEVSQ